MAKQADHLNNEVTKFLDALNHPFRKEIEKLRLYILTANAALTENIKWNGPNYCFENEDRITMRVQPMTAKQIQIIFHCGAKVQVQPKEKLIQTNFNKLSWKSNDRAIVTFKKMEDIENDRNELIEVVKKWIEATS